MQETTVLFEVFFGVLAAGGVLVAGAAQSKLRTAEARRKALQARLDELEKGTSGAKTGVKEKAERTVKASARSEKTPVKADAAKDRRVAELEAALARAEEDHRQLEARYEKRLKELTASAAAAAAASAAPNSAAAQESETPAHLPRPKSILVANTEGAAKASKEPIPLLFATGDGGAAAEMATHLKAAGYAVLPTATVADTVRAARESKPAVIALDVTLGRGGDGFKALSTLKADEALRDIPVVLICAVKDRDRAVELGAAGCVAAPAAPNVLLGALNAALVAHKKRAERSRMARAAKSSAAAAKE